MKTLRFSTSTWLACACASLLAAATAPKPPVDCGAAEGVTVETSAPAVASKETPAQRNARMQWWREAKFGLFIHWGVYAVPAGSYGGSTGYGEWIMHTAKISSAEYRGFARQFNPVKYNPAQWAAIAKDAGMRYVVITSKHHDGFALYPSTSPTGTSPMPHPTKRICSVRSSTPRIATA